MQPTWRHTKLQLLDTTSRMHTGDVLVPFGIDEAYARRCAKDATIAPLVHLWRHEKAVVLGSRDARLPQAGKAVRELEAKGYRTAVRQSGGAAVPLAPGVVNLSLVMPVGAGDLNPEPFFAQMVELIRAVLGEAGGRMSSGEVAGSYCPGTYDLAIDGYKFCGIAQRRLTRAVAVQAFINAEGCGRAYGEIIQSFYETAAQGALAEQFPEVQPERMASLSELGVPGGVAGVAARLRELLQTEGEASFSLLEACPPWLVQEAESALQMLKGRQRHLVGSS